MSFLEIESGEWVRFDFLDLIFFQILFMSFLESGSDLMPDETSLKSNKFQLPISSFRNGLCISSQNWTSLILHFLFNLFNMPQLVLSKC